MTIHRTSVSCGEKEEAAASAELQTVEASLRDVRGQAEQRRAEAASQNSQGAVVKALLAAKASGQISGIHGRLGMASHMPCPCILAGIEPNPFIWAAACISASASIISMNALLAGNADCRVKACLVCPFLLVLNGNGLRQTVLMALPTFD